MGCQMALIKPRTRGKQKVRLITRLYRENNETLYAYAKFLEEDPEYVLNQFIGTKLAKDKEFLRWRASHSESYVPGPSARAKKGKSPHPTAVRVRETGSLSERVSAPAAG